MSGLGEQIKKGAGYLEDRNLKKPADVLTGGAVSAADKAAKGKFREAAGEMATTGFYDEIKGGLQDAKESLKGPGYKKKKIAGVGEEGGPGKVSKPEMREGAAPRQMDVSGAGDYRSTQIGGPEGLGQGSQFKSYQADLANQLAAQARGEGPSLAEQQLRQGTEANIAATMAQQASGRGDPGSARVAMRSAGEARQKMAGQAAMTRLKEQRTAQQQLAGVTEAARQQDIQRELTEYKGQLNKAIEQGRIDADRAGRLYQGKIEQKKANLAAQQEFDRLRAKYEEMGMSAEEANQRAAISVEKLRQGEREMAVNAASAQADRQAGMLGGVLQAGGTVGAAMLSDKRVKENISDVSDKDVNEFIKTLKPQNYNYKNPEKHGEGKYTGIMAQDLMKSKLGRDAVVQFEDGTLGYDTQKMQGINLAVLKHLVDQIEDKGKK